MTALFRPALLLAAALLVLGVFTAQAASISVPGSNAGMRTQSITANALKPGECAALNLTQVVRGVGIFSGTSGNDLILGSPQADTINGGGGNDCILGGGGIDLLTGGAGTDVCIGGPGLDVIDLTCETQIQ